MEFESSTLPDWVTNTFQGFIDDVTVLQEVVELSIEGISTIRSTPATLRMFNSVSFINNNLPDEVQNKIKVAEHRASLAQREVDSDFSLIRTQAVLSLWSLIEDAIKEFIGRWLINIPQTRFNAPWSELQVKVGEYERLDNEQKAYLLLSLVEQKTGSALKSGINRFEDMLGTLQLSGSVADEVRTKIYEMQQVRNVIAHRRGVADARFCKACPNFGVSIGEKLHVSHKRWMVYLIAVHYYIDLLP